MSKYRLIVKDKWGGVSFYNFTDEGDFADAYVSICEDMADCGVHPIVIYSSPWEAYVEYTHPMEVDE